MTHTARWSPVSTARIAGAFYLINFVTGALSLAIGSAGVGRTLNLAASASYAFVTVLLYVLLKPVSGRLSLLAALVGLAGCCMGAFGILYGVRPPIHPLAFFGVYCLLIGLLIFRSTFLPSVLGVLLAIGGLGWLTFAWSPLAHQLSPYNMAPGILFEAALTLWLLVVGVNQRAWDEQANAHSQPHGKARD